VTPDFWIERWEKGEIGFHQESGNDLLPRHWPSLGVAHDATVPVPLCGKSPDMAWLAAQGHRIIGVELSPLAVDDFFREQGVEADTRTVGPFMVRTAGPITIWCGDVFELPAEAVADVTGVYDRGRHRIWHPDFTLPTMDQLIVEYAGMPDRTEYMRGIRHKARVFSDNDRRALFVYPQDLRGPSWPDRLIQRIYDAPSSYRRSTFPTYRQRR